MKMSQPETKIPLIFIVGPTASGKTDAGIRLARAIGGEVVSADSRYLYRGMDIGTAKPSLEERQDIPHWPATRSPFHIPRSMPILWTMTDI